MQTVARGSREVDEIFRFQIACVLERQVERDAFQEKDAAHSPVRIGYGEEVVGRGGEVARRGYLVISAGLEIDDVYHGEDVGSPLVGCGERQAVVKEETGGVDASVHAPCGGEQLAERIADRAGTERIAPARLQVEAGLADVFVVLYGGEYERCPVRLPFGGDDFRIVEVELQRRHQRAYPVARREQQRQVGPDREVEAVALVVARIEGTAGRIDGLVGMVAPQGRHFDFGCPAVVGEPSPDRGVAVERIAVSEARFRRTEQVL